MLPFGGVGFADPVDPVHPVKKVWFLMGELLFVLDLVTLEN